MTETLTLAKLIEALTNWHPGTLALPVHPIIDSRRVARPGAVFFALEGENADGHDYVHDALERGAVAAVIDRDIPNVAGVPVLDLTHGAEKAAETLPPDLQPPVLIRVPAVLAAMQKAARWWRQQLDLRVIGVTGSVGKTTTKEIAGRVLSRHYEVAWSRGSYNNEIGLPLTVLGLTGTCERLVQEMGMYVRGDIRFLADIVRPEVGIVTNVEPVHAERAGSIEEIALGKRELVEALPPAPEGVAILNYDDARVRAMADHTQARVLTYGLSPEADLWAQDVEALGLGGLRATLRYGDAAVPIELALLGWHSIYGALRGAAVGLVEGLSWEEIAAGLASITDPLRLVAVEAENDILVLDDTYNSSPPSALAALELLDGLEGRKVAVLGDMLELGSYERDGHLEVGCRAAEIVSELVVVGDLGPLLAQGAARCGLSRARIHTVADSEAAIPIVREILEPEDVVLIKGSRGVAMEKIVAALKVTESEG